MTANIDIKALACEIARHHTLATVIKECENLIGECDPDIDDYYTIECGTEDGYLGYDWGFDIRITPDVRYHLMGGYDGCDESDCDHIVCEVRGIDYVCAYWAGFSDADGNEYELDEKQLEELKNKLEDAIYEA